MIQDEIEEKDFLGNHPVLYHIMEKRKESFYKGI